MIGIYKITSPTGKVYIGQSVDIKKRFLQHKKDSKKRNNRLYNSIKKHGYNNHFFEIIELCHVDLLNDRERYWQEFYNVLGRKGLNSRYTSSNEKSGFLSEETKEKLRKKDVSYLYGNDFRKGIKHSEEIKEQIRKTLKNNAKKTDYINPMTGKKGILNPFYGKKHSEETREKISFKLKKNNKNSERLKAYNESRKIKLLDLSTGLFFDSISEASYAYELNKSTLKAYLAGKINNKTNLIKI